MKKAERYSKKYLVDEILEIQRSERIASADVLTVYEKALIYKYSNDGYEDLNEKLRSTNGKNDSDFGRALDSRLAKLPSYKKLVYRGANLTRSELAKYEHSYKDGKPLTEHTFVSTSKSRLIAEQYSKNNTFFRILSKSGKEIDGIAKFGKYSPQNEQEVLFRPNREFRVLDIGRESNRTLITMEEI